MQTRPASTLVILGAGGHGRVVADAALAQGAWLKIVVTDRDPNRCVGELLPGVPCEQLGAALAMNATIHIAIGSAQARSREAEALGTRKLATVVHPAATVSQHAHVADGCFVAAHAVIAPNAQLGVSVIVNHGAVVDHDVIVGDFTHIAPLVALGGGARIGRHVLVGSGSRVLPGVSIADKVIIGAGAVVRESIMEAGSTWAGVPARRVG